MPWFPKYYDSTSYTDLAYPPSGGRLKLVLLGVVLPGILMFLGVSAYLEQKAIWFGQGGNMTVSGNTAQAIGALLMSIALFCHSRWFWGILSIMPIFLTGTIISAIAVIISGVYATYFALSHGA